jgi:hypothetical protein
MKHNTFLNKKITYLLGITILTSWNGSMVDTNTKDKRPDMNFYGHLEDHTLKTEKIEDILIGGKYEQIAVYKLLDNSTKDLVNKSKNDEADTKSKEKLKDLDPRQNKVLLDLQEVSSIELKYPERPVEHEVEINNKKYVEVIVGTITGTKNDYMIESNRELSCKKIDKGPEGDQKPVFEERKLNMIHVRKLVISGYKSNPDKIKSSAREAAESDKTKVSTDTEKILDEMEQKVNNLSKQDPSSYEKIKKSLLSLLRSLRNQLQKIVDMIKS